MQKAPFDLIGKKAPVEQSQEILSIEILLLH